MTTLTLTTRIKPSSIVIAGYARRVMQLIGITFMVKVIRLVAKDSLKNGIREPVVIRLILLDPDRGPVYLSAGRKVSWGYYIGNFITRDINSTEA